MTERYPDDAALLALTEDEATGVAYIPTGRTPYHLEFRRMLQRLLLVAGRANDLRVFQDADLSVGVRGGRCFVGGAARVVDGAESISVTTGSATYVWVDSAGAIQTGSALPADRTQFLPLALVTTGEAAIATIEDLRGEVLMSSPTLGLLGVTATTAEIDRALSGAAATVTAAATNRATGGAASNADGDHRHLQSAQEVAGEAFFSLVNISADAAAQMSLAWSLPNRLIDAVTLGPNTATGFLEQRFDGRTFNLVGAVHAQFGHEGALAASATGRLMGAAAVQGTIVDVILSVGANMQSSAGADGVAATVRKNGLAVTSTAPAITSAAGTGFRSTDRGDGAAAVMKSDGSERVERGDLLTVDLARTAAGTVTGEAIDVVVLVVIRVDRPE